MASRKQHILVAAGDPRLQRAIRRMLEQHGFRVTCADDGAAALALCEQEEFDLLVLNLALPTPTGIPLCAYIRRLSAVPIIALAATVQLTERMKGFALGADDCLSQPFAFEELLVRIQALLQRGRQLMPPPQSGLVRCGTLAIDMREHRVFRAGVEVHLTRTEWALLELLLRHTGMTLAHRTLLQRVWGEGYEHENEYLRTFIRRLRQKLEDDPATPRYLLTEPGLGYRFAALPTNVTHPTSEPATGIGLAHLSRRGNLPAPLTSFVGRVQEREAIRILVRPEVRLLTLIGPGGAGKTRLALHVAVELRDAFAHGVFLVALASIGDARLVLPTIAHTLGLKENSGQPLIEQLQEYLRDRQLLLILDNCEHVRATAPEIAELLAAAPGLTILATSRAPLHLMGEQEYPVQPLAVPDPQRLPPLAELACIEAVALFLARAQALKPTFALTRENAASIAAICARLDGLPLAIELAAAWVKTLTPQAILAQLDRPLHSLTGGTHDRPQRHRMLRRTIDWSYELLDAAAQSLFARLGVFVGGWTIAAAQAVCGTMEGEGGDDRGDSAHLADELATLLDHSLLWQTFTAEGEVRMGMLETIRAYALERLAERAESAMLQRLHATYYLALVELAEPELKGVQQQRWFDRVECELDNIRAALAWSLEQQDTDTAMRLAGAMGWFWHVRGYWSEGRAWLERIVVQTSGTASVIRVKVCYMASSLAWFQGDHTQARALAEEVLALSQEMGDAYGRAAAQSLLGLDARYRSDYVQARALLQESLAQFRILEDAWSSVIVQLLLGFLAVDQGDTAYAQRCGMETLARCQELGDRQGITQGLIILGRVALQLGDAVQAITYGAESLALCQELEDRQHTPLALLILGYAALQQNDAVAAHTRGREALAMLQALNNKQDLMLALTLLGWVALQQGDGVGATQFFAEHLAVCRVLDARPQLAQSLEGFASIAAAHDQAVRAVRLWGAADALRTTIGVTLPPADKARMEPYCARAQAQIGAVAWATAWAEGQVLSVEQVSAYVLEEADVPPPRS